MMDEEGNEEMLIVLMKTRDAYFRWNKCAAPFLPWELLRMASLRGILEPKKCCCLKSTTVWGMAWP